MLGGGPGRGRLGEVDDVVGVAAAGEELVTGVVDPDHARVDGGCARGVAGAGPFPGRVGVELQEGIYVGVVAQVADVLV